MQRTAAAWQHAPPGCSMAASTPMHYCITHARRLTWPPGGPRTQQPPAHSLAWGSWSLRPGPANKTRDCCVCPLPAKGQLLMAAFPSAAWLVRSHPLATCDNAACQQQRLRQHPQQSSLTFSRMRARSYCRAASSSVSNTPNDTWQEGAADRDGKVRRCVELHFTGSWQG